MALHTLIDSLKLDSFDLSFRCYDSQYVVGTNKSMFPFLLRVTDTSLYLVRRAESFLGPGE